MKIVIDIKEEIFEELTKYDKPVPSGNRLYDSVLLSIYNGIPLPRGHGDLIDKRKFKRWIETQDGDRLMTEYYLDALDTQETVVGGSYDEDID